MVECNINYIDIQIPKWNEIKLPNFITNYNIEHLTKINRYQIAAIINRDTKNELYSNIQNRKMKHNEICYREILIYNIHNETWKILENKLNFKDNILLFRFNQINKQLEIIYLSNNHNLNWYNPLVLKYIGVKSNLQFQPEYKILLIPKDYDVGGVFCHDKNTIHIVPRGAAIKDTYAEKEHIWHITNNQLITQNIPYASFDNYRPAERMVSILVPSKKMILRIVQYEDFSGPRYQAFKIGIWKYCLIQNKWNKLNLNISHSAVTSCVLTPDEQYVIIANEDNIYILDLQCNEEYKMKQSPIKLPPYKVGLNHEYCINMIILGGPMDLILTYGWIRKLFQKFKHLLLPHKYLIEMISKWYSQPTLHVFYTQNQYHNNYKTVTKSKHYEILLCQILDYSDC